MKIKASLSNDIFVERPTTLASLSKALPPIPSPMTSTSPPGLS